MQLDGNQGNRAGFSEREARHEALALAAYHHALTELSSCRHEPYLLTNRLGDVDEQASHPTAEVRLTLAGRLIAAAQIAERERLPESEVQALVHTWLANRARERDDAAPAQVRRMRVDDERLSGFTHALQDASRYGGFSRVAWAIARAVLQHLIRPTIEPTRADSIRATLKPLADAALDLADKLPPWDGAPDSSHGTLAANALRMRDAGRVLRNDEAPQDRRKLAWLVVAAGAAHTHARWSRHGVGTSMACALRDATERLASSLVPDQPDRFPQDAALEQAVQAAFEAAVTALGLAVDPADHVFVQCERDVVESLLEATSSGLIGAWAVKPAPL